MFWERVEPYVTDRLRQAVEKSYAVFAGYSLDGIIRHCACSVCMTRHNAESLSSLPLKEISAGLLAEYTNSAHCYDRTRIEPEFKHFLPAI